MKLNNNDLQTLVHKFIKLHPDFAEKIGTLIKNGIEKEISLWSDFVNKVSAEKLFDYTQYSDGLGHRIFIEFYKDNIEQQPEIIKNIEKSDTIYRDIKKVTNNFLLLINNPEKYDKDKYWWLYSVPVYIVDYLEKQPRQKSYTLTHSGTGIREDVFQFGVFSRFGKASSKAVDPNTLNISKDLIVRINKLLQRKLENYDVGEYNTKVKQIAQELKNHLKDARVIYYNWQSEPALV
jgi:hypothetical protein